MLNGYISVIISMRVPGSSSLIPIEKLAAPFAKLMLACKSASWLTNHITVNRAPYCKKRHVFGVRFR